MAQKRRPDQTKLAEAALSIADEKGWASVTFPGIAKKAKISQRRLEEQFADTWDILKWILERLESDTKDKVQDYLTGDWRDNLGEILMTRFDLAQKHRAAFISIPATLAGRPRHAARFARRFCKMLDNTLKLAGLDRQCFQPFCVAGLGAVYLSLMDVWRQDDTPDLAKTMAAIDRRLDLFERIVESLPAVPGPSARKSRRRPQKA